MTGTTPRRTFRGDWPVEAPESQAATPRAGDRDSGVRYADELCPSCGKPINKFTAECGCSD